MSKKIKLKCENCGVSLKTKRCPDERVKPCPNCGSDVCIPPFWPPTSKQVMFAKSLEVDFDESEIDRVTLSRLIDKAIQGQAEEEFDRGQARREGYEEFLRENEDRLLENASFEDLVKEMCSRDECFCLFRMSHEEFDKCMEILECIERGSGVDLINQPMQVDHDDLVTTNTWLQVLYVQMANMARRGEFEIPG